VIVKPFAMRRFICGLAAACLVLPAAQALDLTPKPGTRQGNEGPPTSTLVFTDGKAQFDYVPPLDWRPSGGGNTLSFYTPDPKALVKLMVVGKGNSQKGASMSNDDIQAWATKFIPGGAEKVEFVKLTPGPFSMGGRTVNECTFKFETGGIKTSLTVSMVDFSDKEWLLMLVSVPGKNFDQIRQQAISSMFSWTAKQ